MSCAFDIALFCCGGRAIVSHSARRRHATRGKEKPAIHMIFGHDVFATSHGTIFHFVRSTLLLVGVRCSSYSGDPLSGEALTSGNKLFFPHHLGPRGLGGLPWFAEPTLAGK